MEIVFWLAVAGAYLAVALATARRRYVAAVDHGAHNWYAGMYNGDSHFEIGMVGLFWPISLPILIMLWLIKKFVARPTPGQLQRARTDAENRQSLDLARIAVEAGLARGVPTHLLEWERERERRKG